MQTRWLVSAICCIVCHSLKVSSDVHMLDSSLNCLLDLHSNTFIISTIESCFAFLCFLTASRNEIRVCPWSITGQWKMLKRPVTVTTGCMIYAFLKVVYQAWKTVFNHISKHQEEILKCDMQQGIFDKLWGVWNCDVWYTNVLNHTHYFNMVTASVLFKSLSTCIILHSRNEYHHVTNVITGGCDKISLFTS